MYQSQKFVKIMSPIALAIALSACGGGSASFGNASGGDGTTQQVTVSSIELNVSSRQLQSDGSSPITITAIAKDQNNNAIDNANIVFSVDKDATILKDATVTVTADPNDPDATPTTVVTAGSVQTATLTPGSPMIQTLNVSASSGGQSETISVDVVGTTVTIDGPSAITINQESPFTLKLKDSSNKPIAFQDVTLVSQAGNTLTSDSSFQTNAAGEIVFNVLGLAGGVDTISASVLGTSVEKNISVSGDEFALSGGAQEIPINTDYTINFVWKKEGVPQVGETITLSATRGNIDNQTAVTDAAGNATFNIWSGTAGQTIISATTTDGLSTTLEREFIAVTPAYLNTQADPTLISPNGTSTIIAKIRDVNDNPVKNKIIDFRLNDTVDGTLSASTAITDSLGRASVSYKAGNSSSAKDGVSINTFIQGYPAVPQDEVKLTVGGNALRITLGDDNLLATEDVFYIKQFGVIVTDSAGNPIGDQPVSFTINPINYKKGIMVQGAENWVQRTSVTCPSEDLDKDGNLDFGEDDNGNGTLEPTHDAVVTGSGVTDASGKIVVEVVYPKNTALWTDQRISSTLVVAGTEFIEHTDFSLPILAQDVDLETTPPNSVSPYGISDSCFDNSGILTTFVTTTIVDAITGATVTSLENNKWYRPRFVDDLGNEIDRTFTVTSSVATVEMGPNNSFRLIDDNPAVDNSGFFITLSSNGFNTALFYSDDTPVLPPADTVPPIINLNGLANIILNEGDVYNEQGANAVDAEDGVITVNQIGSVPVGVGNITTTPGTFTIIYIATDSSGNSSQVTRTVTVNAVP